ncbi:MAG: hypothetical protein ABFS34_13605 [Gemmatimonadota bacterium]
MSAPQSAERQYLSAWMVLGAMVSGMVVAALVFGLVRGGADPSGQLRMLVLVWAVWGPLSVGAAKAVQVIGTGRARGAQADARTGADGSAPADAQRATAAHVSAWALAESGALLGLVIYFLGGPSYMLWAPLVPAAIGFAITAPKRESFGLR